MKHAPDDYALVIGLNDYPDFRPLVGARKDAEAFAAWLKRPDGGGLPDENVRLLISTKGGDSPTHADIDAQVEWIKKEVSRTNRKRRFYFYFSGHGLTTKGESDGGMNGAMLCLPKWSDERRGAALRLQSYVTTAIDCFGFEEGIYLLDCCRTGEWASVGQGSEHECGNAKPGRPRIVIYGAGPYLAAYEAEIGPEKEVRGFFTAALMEALKRAPLSLPDLLEQLDVLVPKTSNQKQQADYWQNFNATRLKQTILGPPPGGPEIPPPGPVPVHPPDTRSLNLSVKVRTKLEPFEVASATDNRITEINPSAGRIFVFEGDHLKQWSDGSLESSLPPGTYTVRVVHGDATSERLLELDADQSLELDIPGRLSSAPLSSTRDKHEYFTDVAVAKSKWQPAEGEEKQGVFIFARTPRRYEPIKLNGPLVLSRQSRGLYRGDEVGGFNPKGFASDGRVFACSEGSYLLSFAAQGEEATRLVAIPVAKGWDTQVFVVAKDGRATIEHASILMQPARRGLKPADGLLDIYERAISDLQHRRGGPDEQALQYLLHQKFQNPLFGLVGAHFLLRQPEDWFKNYFGSKQQALTVVLNNIEQLLGEQNADLQSLTYAAGRIAGKSVQPFPVRSPPLLAQSLEFLVEATGDRLVQFDSDEALSERDFETMVLGQVANTPWNCWTEASIDAPHYPQWLVEFGQETVATAKRQKRVIDVRTLVLETRLPRSLIESVTNTEDAGGALKGNA